VPSGTAPPCDSTSFETFADVAYADHPSALLDLMVPRDIERPMPLVVWVHGGGWRSGDKADRAQAQRLLCRGYALASINYRLSDAAIFPAQIHDVKAAVRFLRSIASNYEIDPTRIAVFGSSAGGHLAALAGSSDGDPALEDLALGSAGASSRVQAVVDWYGPTRLNEMDAQLRVQGCPAVSAQHNQPGSAESALLGCAPGDADCADEVQRADPSRHADAVDPPHLLLHGTDDCVSPEAQSTLLAAALGSAGACVVSRRVLGAAHGGPEWMSPPVQDTVSDFLDRTLARGTLSPVVVNCAAFLITGDATASAGARWTYHSTDAGTEFRLSGVLYVPSAAAPIPAIVVSHGYGGSATGYSSQVARVARDWGMAAIATNYTHAVDAADADSLPQGGDGASDANVARAHKTRDLLSCVGGVDMRRIAAHGHSMGGFVTGQLLGAYPADFIAASHTAGGASETGVNATRVSAAMHIRTPYQLHHGDADNVVDVALDRTLDGILTASGTRHQLVVYPAFDHDDIALDATMLARVRLWYRAHGVP
jgi:acetyl esterase/lipase